MTDLLATESERRPGYDDGAIFDELRDCIRSIPGLAKTKARDVGFLAEYIESVASKAAAIVDPDHRRLWTDIIDRFTSDLTSRVCELLKMYESH